MYWDGFVGVYQLYMAILDSDPHSMMRSCFSQEIREARRRSSCVSIADLRDHGLRLREGNFEEKHPLFISSGTVPRLLFDTSKSLFWARCNRRTAASCPSAWTPLPPGSI